MVGPSGIGPRLAPFFAVATLLVGILAALFGTVQLAVAVFVVGWLLLVPGSAVLFGSGWTPAPGADPDEWAQYADEMRELEAQFGGSEGDGAADPVDELRDRYARGEIDEAEFERKLEALLETEAVDADDPDAVQRAVERLESRDGVRSEEPSGKPRSNGSEREREPE